MPTKRKTVKKAARKPKRITKIEVMLHVSGFSYNVTNGWWWVAEVRTRGMNISIDGPSGMSEYRKTRRATEAHARRQLARLGITKLTFTEA